MVARRKKVLLVRLSALMGVSGACKDGPTCILTKNNGASMGSSAALCMGKSNARLTAVGTRRFIGVSETHLGRVVGARCPTSSIGHRSTCLTSMVTTIASRSGAGHPDIRTLLRGLFTCACILRIRPALVGKLAYKGNTGTLYRRLLKGSML